MSDQPPAFAALDIGTAAITVILAEWVEGETWKIVGVGRTPSTGIRRGLIVDLERTTEAIARAVADAELMAGGSAGALHVNIGGDHVRSVNSRGVIAVAHRGGAIDHDDVERVLQAARAIPVPPDREVLHVLPQEFIVDDQGGIKDPIGMAGARLEVAVHIVTGSALAVGNIHHCVQKAGYELGSLTLSSLAAAEAALTEREREMGVALVDVGAALTEVVVIADDAVRHTGAIPLGGRHVTNDLAIGLRTPVDEAERLKVSLGALGIDPLDEEDPVLVPVVGDQPPREISRRVIAAIVGPRLEEIFQLAKGEIRKAPSHDHLASGVVLTGGGAGLAGAWELAERVFDLPVRVGRPAGLLGLTDLVGTPADAVVVGLVRLAARAARGGSPPRGVFKRLASRISNVLSEFI